MLYEVITEQDEFALESQIRAIKAVDSGRFKDEIIPVNVKLGREEITFDTDEYPNRKANAEKLSKLRTVFKKDGTVTAGNASGINDGASVMVIASEEAVMKYNLKPIAEVVAIGQTGVDPSIMGIAPVITSYSIHYTKLYEVEEYGNDKRNCKIRVCTYQLDKR